MASKNTDPLRWARCRGRNGWDSPIDVPDDMATEALNVHFYDGGLGTKRGGSTSVTISGLSGINALFGGYVPAQDETLRELFAVDDSATNKILRMAGGSTFANLTLKDNLTAASDKQIAWAVLNGKLYIAYDSAVNRIHVFDPATSTTTVHRGGLKPFAAAATVANTGGGAYPATVRYYKTRNITQISSVVVRRSEANASVSFTPSGAGTAARITRPTAISESETHWEVYGSTDNVTFYGPINGTGTAIATTTYDDSSTPSTWATTYDAEPTAGENTPFPSVKYLYSNGVRLFGLGVWESAAGDSHTPQAGTVYITPALDSSSIHDDERCRNTLTAVGRVILGRNAGGVDRGIGGLGNEILAFQSKGIFKLTPTENADVPYRRVQIDDEIGAVSHESIKKAIDHLSKPALYFADPRLGPYRYGANGFEWIGKDVKDLWDTINLAASNKVCWAEYLPEIQMMVYAFATGSANDPDTIVAFDVTEGRPDEDGNIRGGWAKWTGTLAAARCAAIMSSTLGATMSSTLTLYVGASSGTTLLKYGSSALDDNGTTFQAYVQSKAFEVEPLFQDKQLFRSYLLATAQSGITVRQTLIRNFGDDTDRTSDAGLTADGSETRVFKKFADAALTGAATFQVRLGDSAAQQSAFTLDRWYGQIAVQGER